MWSISHNCKIFPWASLEAPGARHLPNTNLKRHQSDSEPKMSFLVHLWKGSLEASKAYKQSRARYDKCAENMEWGDEDLPKSGLLATAMDSDEELQKLLKTLQQVCDTALE